MMILKYFQGSHTERTIRQSNAGVHLVSSLICSQNSRYARSDFHETADFLSLIDSIYPFHYTLFLWQSSYCRLCACACVPPTPTHDYFPVTLTPLFQRRHPQKDFQYELLVPGQVGADLASIHSHQFEPNTTFLPSQCSATAGNSFVFQRIQSFSEHSTHL